jgi:hypothetical protein
MSLFIVTLALVIALLFGVLGVTAWKLGVDQAWREAARRLRGRFDEAGSTLTRTRHIDGVVDGQGIELYHTRGDGAGSSGVQTRCCASVDFSGGLSLKVASHGFWSKLASSLGGQDVETGDEAFDRAFAVKTNDPDRARVWLTPEIRHAIRRLDDHCLEMSLGELMVTTSGIETRADALVELAEVTAAVARRGEELRRFWMDQAEARRGVVATEGPDRLRIDIDDRRVPLRVETRTDEAATAIVARRLTKGGERFALTAGGRAGAEGLGGYVLESDRPEETRRRLGGALEERLRRLGPLRVEADDEELRILATGIEGDAERLAEAMALAEALAADEGRGAYR